MVLDLSEVLSNDGASVSVKTEVTPEKEEFGGNVYTYVSPIKVEGCVKNTSGAITLYATVRTTLSTGCARCNKTAELSVCSEICDNIVRGDDEFGIPLIGNTVDLAPLISEAVLTNIPARVLCSENCKGLCPKCGTNLSEKQCSCESDDGDSPFAALKNMLLKDEV